MLGGEVLFPPHSRVFPTSFLDEANEYVAEPPAHCLASYIFVDVWVRPSQSSSFHSARRSVWDWLRHPRIAFRMTPYNFFRQG